MSKELQITERSRLRRYRERGSYDREVINGILDAMPMCHVGYVQNGAPIVMPTVQWREGNHVYWHASNGGRGVKSAKDEEVCVTVTILDGLVLARSGMHHSANFRSVMVFGKPEMIADHEEKKTKLNTMLDVMYGGRNSFLREITDVEVKQTAVMRLAIDEASAKVRNAGPADDEEDYELPIWAGTLPISMQVGAPVPDPRNLPDVEMPEHVRNFTIG